MDVLTKQQRSYCMSRIRGKNTKPEILLRKMLWHLGLRYRLHTDLPGKPDIVLAKSRIAVFVDGCFWHGCPKHGVKPKTNSEFWDKKINANKKRDKRNYDLLYSDNWKVLRFWEHEIKDDVVAVSLKIMNEVQAR